MSPHAITGPDPHARGGNVENEKGPGNGHARTCPAIDILKATQQGAAPVRCEYRSL